METGEIGSRFCLEADAETLFAERLGEVDRIVALAVIGDDAEEAAFELDVTHCAGATNAAAGCS